MFGAIIFYKIEHPEEKKKIHEEKLLRMHVKDIVQKFHQSPDDKKELFDALEQYCGKPIINLPTNVNAKWDFFHSLFFVMTVVSTIGYGNLAPTTMYGRIIMIFYALIGIPINGFIMIALGDFFGKSFTKLYNRWKDSKRIRKVDTTRLGLVAQIILYLVPGFTFFIFVPSIVIMSFEGWTYDEAVYFAFVTLTTIGFGDYVAGANNEEGTHFIFYEIFLLIWIVGGLGYVVMILNFIAKGMRSKSLQALEQKIATNILRTPQKIRHELRSILEEFLIHRVHKVYKEIDFKTNKIERSQSCPDLTIYRSKSYYNSLERKRAFSVCHQEFILQRIQSDTDLNRIDKDLTFQGTDQQADFLIKVVDALSINDNQIDTGCYERFTDSQILASEKYDSNWSIQNKIESKFRQRAFSDVKYPSIKHQDQPPEHTWYGQSYLQKYAKLIKNEKSNSMPMGIEKPKSGVLTRIKKTFLSKSNKIADVERQSDAGWQNTPSSSQHEKILENTSVADLIRALSAISEDNRQTSSQDNTQNIHSRTRRLPIRPQHNRRSSLMTSYTLTPPRSILRRSSLMPSLPADYNLTTHSLNLPPRSPRRRSLTPVSETPPPSYNLAMEDQEYTPSKIRRFSVRPVHLSTSE